jgi:hypothetical protein
MNPVIIDVFGFVDWPVSEDTKLVMNAVKHT